MFAHEEAVALCLLGFEAGRQEAQNIGHPFGCLRSDAGPVTVFRAKIVAHLGRNRVVHIRVYGGIAHHETSRPAQAHFAADFI